MLRTELITLSFPNNKKHSFLKLIYGKLHYWAPISSKLTMTLLIFQRTLGNHNVGYRLLFTFQIIWKKNIVVVGRNKTFTY